MRCWLYKIFKKKLQEKAVCFINFETNHNILDQIFKDSDILKLTEFVKYKCAQFIINSLRKGNIPMFNEVYTLFSQNHAITQGDQQIRY